MLNNTKINKGGLVSRVSRQIRISKILDNHIFHCIYPDHALPHLRALYQDLSWERSIPQIYGLRRPLWKKQAWTTSGETCQYFIIWIRNKVKADLGIPEDAYIQARWTLARVAKEYDIPEQRIKDYFTPYSVYSGWIVLFSDNKFWPALFRTILITGLSLIGLNLLSILTGFGLAGLRRQRPDVRIQSLPAQCGHTAHDDLASSIYDRPVAA